MPGEVQIVFNKEIVCVKQLWNKLSDDQSVLSKESSIISAKSFLSLLKAFCFLKGTERGKYHLSQFLGSIITQMHFMPWTNITCGY